jgi:hypothetical protein
MVLIFHTIGGQTSKKVITSLLMRTSEITLNISLGAVMPVLK